MDDATKKAFSKWVKLENRHTRDQLATKVELAKVLKECSEDGKIAIITSETDCDHVNVKSTYHTDTPTLMKAMVTIELFYEHVEVDGYIYFGKPSKYPVYHSFEDRILEAFENGHPHSVRG